MGTKIRTTNKIRLATLIAGLFLPTLTLIPFGSVWLWQNGLLLPWALGVMLCVAIAATVQQRYFREPVAGPRDNSIDQDDRRIDSSWTPAERDAWRDVEAVARNVDADKLNSRDAILELGAETLRAVAHRLHPEVKEPLWQFTVPEAFALLERVSRRLHRFTLENVPLGDRLTVANAMAIYRWRSALDVVEKAYDIWRFARLISPATAVTHELRERLSRQMFEFGREQVTDRLVDAYVKEIGRAAIDLYGGRLRVLSSDLERSVTTSSIIDAEAIAGRSNEPLRILVAGQTGVGKSSLVNMLAGEIRAAVDALPSRQGFTPYRLQRQGFPLALLVDSPGLDGTTEGMEKLMQSAIQCDLLICVVPAHRADRDIEHRMLDSFRATFAALPRRRPPPVIIALSHIDRLRPAQEWNPPYDIVAATSPKAESIKAAIESAAGDLDVHVGDIVPISLKSNSTYNIDTLWDFIGLKLPEAQRAKLVRQLADLKPGWNIRRLWSQARGAGRIIGRTFQRGRE